MEVPASPSQRLIVTLGHRWRQLSCPEHQLHLASGPRSPEQVWATHLVPHGRGRAALRPMLQTKASKEDFFKLFQPESEMQPESHAVHGKRKSSLLNLSIPYLPMSMSTSESIYLQAWVPRCLPICYLKSGISWDQNGMARECLDCQSFSTTFTTKTDALNFYEEGLPLKKY